MSPTIPDLPVLVGNGREESHPVPPSQVTMTQLMAPQDTNLMGNVFGGVILAAVDRIAYVCATRHAGRPCVTASFDQVRQPLYTTAIGRHLRFGDRLKAFFEAVAD